MKKVESGFALREKSFLFTVSKENYIQKQKKWANLTLPIESFDLLENSLEAPPGFEPGIRVLQTRALPLGYSADYKKWSR